MAKPTTSAYPDALDSSTTLFGDPLDGVILTLATGIDNAVTSFVVSESISTINVPTFFAFATGEIVYCEAKNDGTKTFSSVTRGVAASHNAGELIKQVLVADYIKQFKSAIIAIETALGTVPQGSHYADVSTFNSSHTHSGVSGYGVKLPATSITQGTGSGLDADTLDTYHASSFALTSNLSDAFFQELSILSAQAPMSAYSGAGIEMIESGGAGTAKPIIPQLNFGSSSINGRMWVFRVKGTPGATIEVKFGYRMSAANTSDSIVMGCQLACVSDGDTSVQNKVFSTTNLATITVPDTANEQDDGTITITNTDGIAKGDWVCLFLYRTTAGNTATGNVLVTTVGLSYV